MAADPSLAGHPVVAGLLTAVERELVDRLRVLEARVAAQDEELADRRRQLGRHSGNSGQPPSQDGPAAARAGGQPGHADTTRAQVTPAQVAVGIEY